MFGYIVLNKPEIKFKDFDLYSSFYCGLCHSLKQRHGLSGQITLSYDLTFIVILLSGLYEPAINSFKHRCIVHPIQKKKMRTSSVTDYAADMNILLSYYKCIDDWNDEKKYSKKAYSVLLKKSCKEVEQRYPQKAKAIKEYLNQLSEFEKSQTYNIDLVSGCFGNILAEIFAYGDKIWEPLLRKMGFFLGKFIYLLDAFDDIEEDLKNKSYNPFYELYKDSDFESKTRQILIMMMSECCSAFEMMPIIEYTDILRNILYSGVWVRFEEICKKRNEKQEINDD
ncbi:MAG: DUF5685 family protein [Eubacteriales bacterium]|nr:DUF5685 family protein [Eubacteriales bacterium]